MRGHALGPFNIQGNLEVQAVLILTPAAPTKQVYIFASVIDPVLLRIVPSVRTAFTGGTNTLIAGTAADDNAYLVTGDTTLATPAIYTEKLFVITESGYFIAALTNAAIAATGVLTISATTSANTQTATIGATTYTFNTSLTNTANHVLIGVGVGPMGDNLAAAINAGAGSGTLYGAGTVANASVTASSNGAGVVTLTAITPGATANSVVTTETLSNSAFADTTLTGGENANTSAGEVTLFLNT